VDNIKVEMRCQKHQEVRKKSLGNEGRIRPIDGDGGGRTSVISKRSLRSQNNNNLLGEIDASEGKGTSAQAANLKRVSLSGRAVTWE